MNQRAQTIKKDATNRIKRLAAMMDEGKTEELMAFLRQMSVFHHYSPFNQILICSQRPSATRVAGFKTWQKLDRWVKKGEHGIQILVPYKFKKRTDDGEDDIHLTFGVGHVFDIAQTDGEPLLSVNETKGDPGAALDRLRALIRSENIELNEFAKIPVAGRAGYNADTGDRTIQTPPYAGDAKQFAVLVHELAHQKLHLGPETVDLDGQTEEAEAEAVAFVVSEAIGLDAAKAVKDYLQSWRVKAELLTAHLTRIQQTATWIIEAITTNKAAVSAA